MAGGTIKRGPTGKEEVIKRSNEEEDGGEGVGDDEWEVPEWK